MPESPSAAWGDDAQITGVTVSCGCLLMGYPDSSSRDLLQFPAPHFSWPVTWSSGGALSHGSGVHGHFAAQVKEFPLILHIEVFPVGLPESSGDQARLKLSPSRWAR